VKVTHYKLHCGEMSAHDAAGYIGNISNMLCAVVFILHACICWWPC